MPEHYPLPSVHSPSRRLRARPGMRRIGPAFRSVVLPAVVLLLCQQLPIVPLLHRVTGPCDEPPTTPGLIRLMLEPMITAGPSLARPVGTGHSRSPASAEIPSLLLVREALRPSRARG